MYYTFNPIRYCNNAANHLDFEDPNGPFSKLSNHVYGSAGDFVCNRGGGLFLGSDEDTRKIMGLYNNLLRTFESQYSYISCKPTQAYKNLNGVEVEFEATTNLGEITNFYSTSIDLKEGNKDCNILIYTNPDDPKNFNKITFMPSYGYGDQKFELTNEKNHFFLYNIYKDNYCFSLSFDRVAATNRCDFGFFLAYYPGCYMYRGNKESNQDYDYFSVDWTHNTIKSFGIYVLMAKDKTISLIPRIQNNSAAIYGSTFGDIIWHNISPDDASIKVCLSYRMPLQLSMQDQLGNNVKWDYELYYYQVAFNNPPSIGTAYRPRRIYWPATDNISPKPICNYRYHVAGITWEYDIEPPKTYEEFVARVKDYSLNRLYFNGSEAHIDIPWPSWT